MSKTQTQIAQEISNYLNKTSKHLFIDKNGNLLKIIPFEKNGKAYYAKVIFGGKQAQISVREQLSDNDWKWYGTNALENVRNSIFSPRGTFSSIPNFKASKVIITKVKLTLENEVPHVELEKQLQSWVDETPLQKKAA